MQERQPLGLLVDAIEAEVEGHWRPAVEAGIINQVHEFDANFWDEIWRRVRQKTGSRYRRSRRQL